VRSSTACACSATLALVLVGPPAAAQNTGRILVVPFENVTRDSRIFWLSEASAVLLADDLNALGADAIARDERREAFERLQVPRAASLTDATVIRIGQLVTASQVIVGTLQLDGDELVVRARSIALEAGRIEHDVTERGPIAGIFGTFERLARRLTQSSSQSDLGRERPSVAAFENYIKGLLSQSAATAISYLNAALQLEPQFAGARLALWDVHTEQGNHERALTVVQRVPADSPLARRSRFRAGLSQIQLKRYEGAFATYSKLADEQAEAAILNNLGVVQLRRGGAQLTGRAAEFFNKAALADPTDSDYFFNLGYAYWLGRDPGAAAHWLREAVRRDPTDGDAHFVLGVALAAAGNGAEANREKELARRLSSTYLEWEQKLAPDTVPTQLERIKGDVGLPNVSRIDDLLAGGGQRDQRELAKFHLDRGRRLYEQESDREALTELNRVLFLSPYEADAHLLVGRIHLRGGRVNEAIDALKISLWSAESVQAHVALAEAHLEAKDVSSARAEAERALARDPSSAEAKRLLDRISER
jgi:tetratricopeptide (TPR) repeat protein